MISKIRFHSDFFWLIVISMLILPVRCLSYNQPRLFNCWNSTNSSVSVTFANSTIVGTSPRGIFIDDTNTFYFAHYANSRLLIWSQVNNSNAPTMTLSVSMSVYTALFVTSKREIYFGASSPPRAIKKITPYSATSTLVHQFSSWCLGLFIDLNETIYCSMYSSDLVRSISLNSSSSGETTRAGNGTKGSASTQLNGTWGIFVDTNYDLYVADAYNNRIQRFLPKETNGTTVAGRGIPNSLLLNFPTDVILDGNGALYIADNMNHRLIRVKSGNYICLTGCTSTPGSGPNQLYKPISLRFDSHGNLYVADEFNNRTQKLIPVPNCETTIVDQSTIVSSLDTSSMLSSSSASIGTLNNISNQPCDILQPCLNDGTCFNNNDTGRGYNCSCSTGFNGDMCQINGRLCQLNMCRNNGSCEEFANATFRCRCSPGWEGDHCEKRINRCKNVTCENRGVCRSMLLDYQCECLGESYSGRHCEIVSTKTMALQTFSKSVSYVCIIIIISFVLFIVAMDVLKYGFGIDPVANERKVQRKVQQRPRPRMAVHHIYVN